MNGSDKKKMEIIKSVTKENKDNHSAHLVQVTAVEETKGSKKGGILVFLLVFALIAAFVIAWFVLKIF